MLKSIKQDLEDACDAFDHLRANFERLTREEQVDVGARLRAAAKAIEAMDDQIKTNIKAWRKNKPGIINGENFKAVLAAIDVNRLDQKAFKIGSPTVYAQYLRADTDLRITFEPK